MPFMYIHDRDYLKQRRAKDYIPKISIDDRHTNFTGQVLKLLSALSASQLSQIIHVHVDSHENLHVRTATQSPELYRVISELRPHGFIYFTNTDDKRCYNYIDRSGDYRTGSIPPELTILDEHIYSPSFNHG